MKKNRFLSIALLSFFSVFVAGTTVTAFVLSKKTPDTIYINNEDELFSISEKLDGYYSLACDISITKAWSPIGTKDKPFTGTIVGNFKTISFTEASLEFIDDENGYCWGFLGYNQGTILRTNFYGIKVVEDFDKTVCFGAVALHNYGKITSCTLKNCNINFSATNVNFGTFVCYNHCDIRNCHLKTNFIIDVDTEKTLAGGLCCMMDGGIIEYCSVSKSSYLIINASETVDEVFLGNAIGLFKGGKISNCFLTSAGTTIKGNGGFLAIGGVAGCFSGEGTTTKIAALFLDLDSFIDASHSTTVSANGLFGHVVETSKIIIKNLLFDIYANFVVGDECTSQSYLTYENSGSLDNSYYLNHRTPAKYKDSDGATHINKTQLSLNLLKWDSAVWQIKNGEVYFLKAM